MQAVSKFAEAVMTASMHLCREVPLLIDHARICDAWCLVLPKPCKGYGPDFQVVPLCNWQDAEATHPDCHSRIDELQDNFSQFRTDLQDLKIQVSVIASNTSSRMDVIDK